MSLAIQEAFDTQAGDTVQFITPADGSFYLGIVFVPNGGQPVQLDFTQQEIQVIMQMCQALNTVKRLDSQLDPSSTVQAPVPTTLTPALKVQPLPPQPASPKV